MLFHEMYTMGRFIEQKLDRRLTSWSGKEHWLFTDKGRQIYSHRNRFWWTKENSTHLLDSNCWIVQCMNYNSLKPLKNRDNVILSVNCHPQSPIKRDLRWRPPHWGFISCKPLWHSIEEYAIPMIYIYPHGSGFKLLSSIFRIGNSASESPPTCLYRIRTPHLANPRLELGFSDFQFCDGLTMTSVMPQG